jgi:putative FmdB family regulatory protein
MQSSGCRRPERGGSSVGARVKRRLLLKPLSEATMPVYDYICKDCQNSFELVLTLGEHDKSDIRCPKCESKNVEQNAVAFYAVTSKKS